MNFVCVFEKLENKFRCECVAGANVSVVRECGLVQQAFSSKIRGAQRRGHDVVGTRPGQGGPPIDATAAAEPA